MQAIATSNGVTAVFEDNIFPHVTVSNNTGSNQINLEPSGGADAPVVVRIRENATATALVFDVNGDQVYPAL